MLLKFCGAASEVTGSCHFVQTKDTSIVMDCGIFQGGEERHKRNRQPFPFKPTQLNAVILSHAHLDHCGRLPLLFKSGFKGKIFATQATCDLARIILLDSAELNKEDADWKVKRLKKKGEDYSYVTPLFTTDDVKKVIKHFEPVPYEEWVKLSSFTRFRFREAGHLLGSAMIEILISANGKELRLIFTGDLGQQGMPILRDPEFIEQADVLLMESTYGDRDHKSFSDCIQSFYTIIEETRRKGGKVLIPSFAVGRTQQLLYILNDLVESGQLKPIPVFVDSPMAEEVLKVYQKHLSLYDEEAKTHLRREDEPFNFEVLKFIRTVEESKQINDFHMPCIIVSGSGMCTGGRIKHHLKHNIGNPNNAIIFIGFQAQGSLGREILDRKSPVRIFGEYHEVKASVHLIDGFSAHADRTALMKWTSNFFKPPNQTFLVHGEVKASNSLANDLRQRNWKVYIPRYGDEVKIG